MSDDKALKQAAVKQTFAVFAEALERANGTPDADATILDDQEILGLEAHFKKLGMAEEFGEIRGRLASGRLSNLNETFAALGTAVSLLTAGAGAGAYFSSPTEPIRIELVLDERPRHSVDIGVLRTDPRPEPEFDMQALSLERLHELSSDLQIIFPSDDGGKPLTLGDVRSFGAEHDYFRFTQAVSKIDKSKVENGVWPVWIKSPTIER